jgi:hypothetical protein
MSFKTQLNDDVVNCFLNTDEFGEPISYTPKGGTAKSIKAQVFRQGIAPASEDTGRVLQSQVEIIIANDATYGVTSINKGGDTVSLPERIGGSNVTFSVADILKQDDGLWHLLLQK